MTKQGTWKLILDDASAGPELFDRLTNGHYLATFDHQAQLLMRSLNLNQGRSMKQMFVVMKETYIRQIEIMEFPLHGLRSLPLLGLSIGIGYLAGSSTDAKTKWPW